jgi:hypothetical protein
MKHTTTLLNGKYFNHTDLSLLELNVRQLLQRIAERALEDDVLTFADFDLFAVLAQDSVIVGSFDPEHVLRSITGIGLRRMSRQWQCEFARLLHEMKWVAEDEPNATSFWIYFGPESDAFDEFIDEIHCMPVRFAKNPPELRAFLGYRENDTVLIVKGRVYTDRHCGPLGCSSGRAACAGTSRLRRCSPSARGRAMAVAKLLFVDLVLPLRIGRVIAIEPRRS